MEPPGYPPTTGVCIWRVLTFLNHRYSIQCLDLATGQELWQTEPQRDYGLTTLAISPDGRVLASGSGFEDPTIRVWDAATGRLLAGSTDTPVGFASWRLPGTDDV